jgi:hypothetical protein
MDSREYFKSNYSAMSLAEAVRKVLPNARVTAVAGTGVVPEEATDIPAAVAAAKTAMSLSSRWAADRRGPMSAPKEKAPTPRTRISPHSRSS